MTRTLSSLARDLAEGKTSSEALTDQCLAAIRKPDGEGARTFIHVDETGARAQARAFDLLRGAGAHLSPYAGIPISIKDLFDVAGQVTRAGSAVLADQPPAARDAEIIVRLRRAGFVILGRTNMSEFAFSGVGINPHYGTPAAPWDRASRRIPGGSSSGAAISVTDGMAFGAIGTDTGGSCRIPAALTGLVGFKPTARRVPLDGAVPLSTSLDSIGPIGRSVQCCAILDAVLAGTTQAELDGVSLQGLRIAVPDNFVTDGIDITVADGFERALSRLSHAGAVIRQITFPEFDTIPEINSLGGFAAAESYRWHRELLANRGGEYDPHVRVRIERGKGQSAADYINLQKARGAFISAVEKRMAGFDIIAMPTVPVVPPRIDALGSDQAFAATNMLLLRNPAVINLLDGCAISLPVHDCGQAPVGLMLAARGGLDHPLLRIASAVTSLFELPENVAR